MDHVEERDFVLRLELRCVFPPDYDGEEDGHAWAEEAPAITAEIVQAAVTAFSRRGRWRVKARNRGRPSDEEITLVCERTPTTGTK